MRRSLPLAVLLGAPDDNEFVVLRLPQPITPR
jgi:hypothetical protein